MRVLSYLKCYVSALISIGDTYLNNEDDSTDVDSISSASAESQHEEPEEYQVNQLNFLIINTVCHIYFIV